MKILIVAGVLASLAIPSVALADDPLVYTSTDPVMTMTSPDDVPVCGLCGQNPITIGTLQIGVRITNINVAVGPQNIGLNQFVPDFAHAVTDPDTGVMDIPSIKVGTGPSLILGSTGGLTGVGTGDGCTGDLQWFDVSSQGYNGLLPAGNYQINAPGTLSCWQMKMTYQEPDLGEYNPCPSGDDIGLQEDQTTCPTALRVARATTARKLKRTGFKCSKFRDTDGERWHRCTKGRGRKAHRVQFTL